MSKMLQKQLRAVRIFLNCPRI